MVPKGRQWSLEEDAFIIAWIDYCLFHAKDYRATITGALHDTFDVQIEFESVRLQLYGLIRQYRKSGKTAKVPSLLKLGAQYLRVKFPEELQKASDVLRREWKIDGEKFESKLLQTVTSESSTTQALSQRESPSGDADTCASPDFAGAETLEKLRPRAVHRNYVVEDSDSDDRDYDLPPLSDGMFQEHTRDGSELPTPADTASGTKRPTVEPLTPAIISPDIFDDNSENADQMVLPRNGAKRVCYDTQSAVVEQTTTAISPRQVIAGPSGADSRTISPDAISGLETQQATLNNQPTGINQLAHFTTINDQLAQSSTTPLKLNHRWAILRRPLQLSASAVGNTIQPPSLYIARYLTDQSKRLLLASAQAQNASSWVHDLALPFFSPHAAQMVMSVVMMSSLFPGCEPLLNGGWRVAAKSLHAGGGSGSAMVVNEYNMPQTRLPTNNPEFQHSGTRIRTTTLTNTWSHSWSTIRPMTRLAVTDAKLRSWVDFAIHLATDMEGSPADYAIRYCRPGAVFDASWMQAEDDGGPLPSELCSGKKVLMCTFPALLQCRTSAEKMTCDGDLRFLVAQTEQQNVAPESGSVVAKAVVWLQGRD